MGGIFCAWGTSTNVEVADSELYLDSGGTQLMQGYTAVETYWDGSQGNWSFLYYGVSNAVFYISYGYYLPTDPFTEYWSTPIGPYQLGSCAKGTRN
jgi:hypothetical protein